MSNDGGPEDPNGVLLGGRYRLVERIGSGGAGTVWRARDELAGREVAVKQPRLPGEPEDEGHRRAVHRLQREARAAARVEHPSAVTVHDVVVEEQDGEGGLPWIVMELVRGESLDETVRRGPLGSAEAARIGLAVLGALRAAHSVGIVHRDVKPANVLVESGTGRVVLTDFGIDHVQGEEPPTAGGEYVAPERVSGTHAGPASDLWSLGALLYTAVDGRPPSSRTASPAPQHGGPLRELIAGLLAPEPDERPEAGEVARVLGELARDAGGESPADGAESAVAVPEMVHATVVPAKAHATVVPDKSPSIDVPEKSPSIAVPEEAREDPAPASLAAPAPTTPSRRRTLLRLAVGPLGILLAGGIWLGTSFADGAGEWVAHREGAVGAVLYLPRQYRQLYQVGEAGDASRLSVYHDEVDEVVAVQFAEWDRAPAAPLAEAKEAVIGMEGHERGAGRYTATTFQGAEAALSDVTYDPDDRPVRVLQLVVRTDDGRMYQLQVRMPKGTPEERKGAALFKGARARLEIGRK
ncbi:serine/threonine-protein kinase [Streptomyces sp. SID13726]|uniref:serine/threonine-protein kinase n=1 Tax=Streptomyces sp. SID13726 TaxID=2706058 RepID=UPI0013B63690|nr:serine/threonine-protein kinase [Streptomyces sp. SID13726]NEA99906.1 protein kinase [Streptomyces sp. SID13726]